MILVRTDRSTFYAGFTIDAKALSIIGDGSRPTVRGPNVIRNTSPGQDVLIQGIHANHRLEVTNNQGHVLVEDCRFLGRGDLPAVDVVYSRSAVFSRCHISGIITRLLGQSPGNVAPGLQIANSVVTLYDSTVLGGSGAPGDAVTPPGPGREGVRMGPSGVLMASGTTIQGGNGGEGLYVRPPFPVGPVICEPVATGGRGGDGLVLAGPNALVFQLDSPIGPGVGGPGGCIYYGTFSLQCQSRCPSGPPGLNAIVGTGGTITQRLGDARSYTADSPAFDQSDVAFGFAGRPGDTGVLYAAFEQNHVPLPQWSGALAPKLGPGGFVPFVGRIDPTGMLDTVLPMAGSLIPPGRGSILYTQGLFVGRQGGIFSGPTGAIAILDQTHDPRDGCGTGDGTPK